MGDDTPVDLLGSALLQALMQQSQVGVAVCDNTGVLRAFNTALTDMLGPPRPTPHAVWALEFDLYDADGRVLLPTDQIPLVRALRGEVVTDQRLTMRRAGEPLRTLVCSAAPIESTPRQIEGALVLVTETTHQVSEQQLRQERAEQERRYRARVESLQQLTGRLFTVLDHQIRTPLGVLSGYLELLSGTLLDQPRVVTHALTKMATAADRLGEVADTITASSNLGQAAEPPSSPSTSPTSPTRPSSRCSAASPTQPSAWPPAPTATHRRTQTPTSSDVPSSP